jgi:thioredoxin-related protein
MRLVAAAVLALALLPAQARESWEKFFSLGFNDLPAELAEARASGKKGLLLIYQQDPCPYCERMKANILARADVQKWYGLRFAAFSIDIRGSAELVDFAGRKTTEASFAREALVQGAPIVDFYDLQGKLLARVPGEIKDASTFLALGDWIASGAQRKESFEAFRAARGLDATPLKINQFKP